MSVTVSLAELADMAFGTADGGSPQVGVLRILLRGLLENLHPRDAAGGSREEERGLLEPTASVAGGKPNSLHQQASLARAEGQQSHSSGSPGTAELPAPGPAAANEWQMLQLKERMDVTEEEMTKVMDMLQEMFTTVGSLKTTTESFQEELQLLRDSFHKADICQELRRSSLCGVPTSEELSDQEFSPEASQEPAHEASCRLSWLLEQHETVGTHIHHHKSQLQQHADSGTLKDMAARLKKEMGEMRQQQDEGEKGLDFGREVLDEVRQLQEQCTMLQKAAERLWGDTKDTQGADKATLEPKASQEELQHTMVQMSKMMQDLLQRMSLLEQDRQKTLEKLLSKVDSKLDCAALAPLQAQLEQMWMLTQQHLCQEPCCGASHAAGFKRQLFNPVKCISCDRPLAMAPHVVTPRKASQHLQTQPASAGGSNRPPQRLPRRESTGNSRASRGPASPAGPLSASSSTITLCPHGEHAGFISKSREVDIFGIDGVIYKGRLDSTAANRTITMGTNIPEMKTAQPCSRHTTEKMYSSPKHGSHYVSPYSRAATRTKVGSSGGRWQAAMGGSRKAGV